MSYFLYVLRSLKDRKLYIGVSSNPGRRLVEHNKGKSRSTKYRKPFVLIYTETFSAKTAAYKREWFVKNTGEGNIDLKRKIDMAR